MNDTEARLRDVLHAVVPEPPPVPAAARVARAQSRGRRRSVLLGVAAAGTATAVVAAVLVASTEPDPRPRPGVDRVQPLAVPSGATPDPLTAPVRRRSEIAAPALPEPATEGYLRAVVPWSLVARSDDAKAFLVRARFQSCQAFERFEVEQRPDYVLVSALLRKPGVKAVCLGNKPPVTEVTYVVQLAEPLGERPLLHAPVGESVAATG